MKSKAGIKSKKSLSTIVATLLLVIITVVGSSILFLAFKKLINQPSLSPMQNCLMQTKAPITILKACYNNSSKEIEIELSRVDEKLDIFSIEFIIKFRKETKVWHCGEDCKNCEVLKESIKTYYIISEKIPETLTLKIEECIFETKRIANC